MKVFFWQNIPSHHQSGALRTLASLWPDEIHGIWCWDVENRRKARGWLKPDFGKLIEHTLPADYAPEVVRLIEEFPDAIHIFSGFRGYGPVELAFKLARKKKFTRQGVIAEGLNLKGFRGLTRSICYRYLSLVQRQSVRVALVMGQAGVECYRKMGYFDKSLFPYIYQCDTPCYTSAVSPKQDFVKFAFVGSPDRRKGLDILLRGLQKYRGLNWHLTVIGDCQSLKAEIDELGLSSQITLYGKCPSDKVVPLLREQDVCVVPSRHDGWGIVTNEAINAGIGAIVSDAAASHELVKCSGAGTVFSTDNQDSLDDAIKTAIQNKDVSESWKQKACKYAPNISGASIGQYLAQVLEYVFIKDSKGERPRPPWI
jgi:glycosyltransferase involved in cell wall biosynthesis